MEKNKLPNNNEIKKEKKKLQQEVKRLDIYENCNDYGLDRFLCYFPNRATEITDCFYKEEDEKYERYALRQKKKTQLQKIIMEELCSLLYPCIEKGFKVKQLNGGSYSKSNQKYLICLNTPENYKHIGISIGQNSKMVSTNAIFDNDDIEKSKLRFFPKSGIHINYSNFFCNNAIRIQDRDINYRLIINLDTENIQLTDAEEKTEYKTFCDKKNEIFQNKKDIIHFFSTLSFAEIEQVLQVFNKHLKGKKYNEVDIKTVLKEIKDTIESKRNKINSSNKNEIKKINLLNSNYLNNEYLNGNIDINQNESEKEKDKTKVEKDSQNNSSRFHLCNGMCENPCIGYDEYDNWRCFT